MALTLLLTGAVLRLPNLSLNASFPPPLPPFLERTKQPDAGFPLQPGSFSPTLNPTAACLSVHHPHSVISLPLSFWDNLGSIRLHYYSCLQGSSVHQVKVLAARRTLLFCIISGHFLFLLPISTPT
jgi:hypothetical protein